MCSSACCKKAALVLGALLLLLALEFSAHYALLGESALLGVIGSARLVTFVNTLWCYQVRSAMRREGIPVGGNFTEWYASPGGGRLAPTCRAASHVPAPPRPAVLYFHAGAWSTGGRELARARRASSPRTAPSGGGGVPPHVGRGGAGVAGAVDDAWAAPAHGRPRGCASTRAASSWRRLRRRAARAAATRLRAPGPPAPRAAAIGGWPVVTPTRAAWFAHRRRGPPGRWRTDGTAAAEMATPSVLVPAGTGDTPEATQRQLGRNVIASFSSRSAAWRGWLPATSVRAPPPPLARARASPPVTTPRPLPPRAPQLYSHERGAALSPLGAAEQRGLPPMLLLSGGADTIVPSGQVELFAEAARRRGNDAALVVFERADHGGGGFNTRAGRDAVLRFLATGAAAARRRAATARRRRSARVRGRREARLRDRDAGVPRALPRRVAPRAHAAALAAAGLTGPCTVRSTVPRKGFVGTPSVNIAPCSLTDGRRADARQLSVARSAGSQLLATLSR